MREAVGVLIIALILAAQTALGQSSAREPHIGYLYPGGGRQGTTVRIMAGGQYLNGISGVYVSEEGVRASVVRYMGPARRLNGPERRELARRLSALMEERRAESPGEDRGIARRRGASGRSGTGRPGAAEEVKLPNHPLFNQLEELSLEELEFVEERFLKFDPRRQPNNQIAELVSIEVAIDGGAAPGDRELRLVTPRGLTNPLCFQVGFLPEICEQEPNERGASDAPPVDTPFVMNGQIMPGDVDRFRFRAREGQQLVVRTQARHLIPYLADAVPGWIQATLALYDEGGRELAFADDFRFDPDPVLFCRVPESGVYELEIRDSIYRGREDFVYRVSVGELPFIRSMFPLGGREGGETAASIEGWNLPVAEIPLDTRPGSGPVREAMWRGDGWCSNPRAYAVDSLAECGETEPNDDAAGAQRIEPPVIVNGRIAHPGDADVFRIKGRAGDEVVAEVTARRLRSPLDSLLQLIDEEGSVLKWNDDHEEKNGHLRTDMGVLTHHADSYLRARLPGDGEYCIRLLDAQGQGGGEYGYRLRIGPPQPDFALRVAPSGLAVLAGGSGSVCVHILRKNGFDGDIEVALKDAPEGFILSGGRIPAGRDRIRLTLTAPRRAPGRPVALQWIGRARIGGRTVERRAVPSEDQMQAFLYRHLVPSQEFVVAVKGTGMRLGPLDIAGDLPVRIPVGGTARVRISTPRRAKLENIRLELSEAPEGVSLQKVAKGPSGLSLVLKADGRSIKPGFSDNLIVEAFTERAARRQSGKSAKRMQRVSLGALPAIPIEIVGYRDR